MTHNRKPEPITKDQVDRMIDDKLGKLKTEIFDFLEQMTDDVEGRVQNIVDNELSQMDLSDAYTGVGETIYDAISENLPSDVVDQIEASINETLVTQTEQFKDVLRQCGFKINEVSKAA